MRLRTLGATTIAMLVLAPFPTAAAEPATGWTVVPLPVPAGFPESASRIEGTDHHGTWSGTILTDQGSVAVTWTATTATSHGRPAGYETAVVRDQNRRGTIVGDSFDRDVTRQRAWRLDAGTFTLLPLPQGHTESYASAINDRGDIFGGTRVSIDDPLTPVVWWADNPDAPRMVPLSPEFQERIYTFVDLDHDGSLAYNTHDGAGLWKDGTFTAFPTYVDGIQPAHTAAMVDGGRAIGQARLTTTVPIVDGCVYWPTPTSRPEPLPNCWRPFSLNRDGLIVGEEPTPHGAPRVFATWQDGEHTGRIPVPADYPGAAPGLVGDDGTIAGLLRTTPSQARGVAAVWLPTTTLQHRNASAASR